MNPHTQNHTTPQPSHVNLIDAHVHLYDCFDRTTFFDAALTNFNATAKTLGLPTDTPRCLMLTETSKDHAFESLIQQRQLPDRRWSFTPNDDGRSLNASLHGQNVITVFAGRQVVTRQGLEVLALCSNGPFADGLATENTIEEVIDADALPVLPYGVGKWTGTRGKIIDRLLNSSLADKLLLGDNAGRLAIAGEPKPFAHARHKNIYVLPGTDPLPFPSQALGVARFGLVLDSTIDPAQPAGSIKNALSTLDAQPKTFGRASGVFPFLRLQLAMQMRKRLGRKS